MSTPVRRWACEPDPRVAIGDCHNMMLMIPIRLSPVTRGDGRKQGGHVPMAWSGVAHGIEVTIVQTRTCWPARRRGRV